MAEGKVWRQNIYGKLVKRPGGPILPNYEHRCTGVSENLSPEISVYCYPHKIGLGNSEMAGWYGYPWPQGKGGIILRPVATSSEWYLVAGRVRPLSESGENEAHGRQYTQAHYLVAPAKHVSDMALFGLPEALSPQPMTEINAHLPHIAISEPVDVALPEGWLEEFRPYLEPVLCGQAVAVQDWTVTPDQFFRTALLCLACLPRALRWRLPIGSGLSQITSDVAFGHGQSATGGVRRIAKVWKGREDIEGTPALERAKTYLEWVKCIAPRASTVRELHTCIDRAFKTLSSWDALNGLLPQERPWQDAVQLTLEFHDELNALKELREYLRPNHSQAVPPAMKRFRDTRTQALDMVVTSALGLAGSPGTERGGELLSQMCEESWCPAWVSLAQDQHAVKSLGMVLGRIQPLEVDLIENLLTRNLPACVHDVVTTTVTSELSKAHGDSLSAWAPLIKASGPASAADWLRHFRKAVGRNLVWKGAVLDATCPGENCLTGWVDSPHASALCTLIKGTAPNPDDYLDLLNSFFPDEEPELAFPILDSAWRRGRFAEAILLNAKILKYGKQAPLSSKLELSHLARGSERRKIAFSAADFLERQGCSRNSGHKWPESLVELVLAFWHHVPVEAQRALAPGIRNEIGVALATLLCPGPTHDVSGPRCPVPNSIPPLADRALRVAMTLSKDVVARVVGMCERTTHTGPLPAIFTDWFKSQEPSCFAETPAHAYLAFASGIRLGRVDRLPDLTLSEARTVLYLTSGTKIQEVLFRKPERIMSVGCLRAYLIASPPKAKLPNMTEKLFADCLRLVLEDVDEREFWGKQLHRLRMEDEEKWRLLRLIPPRDLSKGEVAVIATFDKHSILGFVLKGWALPEELLDKIDKEVLQQEGTNRVDVLTTILGAAEKAKARNLAHSLLCHILELASQSPTGRISVNDLRRNLAVEWDRLYRFLCGAFRVKTEIPLTALARRALRISKDSEEDLFKAIVISGKLPQTLSERHEITGPHRDL